MSKISRIGAPLGLVALALGGAAACGSSQSSGSSASAQSQPLAQHEPMTEEEYQLALRVYDMSGPSGWTGAVVFNEDGKYVVGRDIHQGDYKIKTPATGVDPQTCHWELYAADGSLVTDSKALAKQVPGPAPDAKGLTTGQTFTTENCGTWVLTA